MTEDREEEESSFVVVSRRLHTPHSALHTTTHASDTLYKDEPRQRECRRPCVDLELLYFTTFSWRRCRKVTKGRRYHISVDFPRYRSTFTQQQGGHFHCHYWWPLGPHRQFEWRLLIVCRSWVSWWACRTILGWISQRLDSKPVKSWQQQNLKFWSSMTRRRRHFHCILVIPSGYSW